MIVVRYADDTVVGFEHRADAERFLVDPRIRMAEFDLELQRADRLSQHRSASRLDPEKTRLVEFGRHAASDRTGRGDGKPETFNFLGFTHICSRSRGGVVSCCPVIRGLTGSRRSWWRSTRTFGDAGTRA